ncbi:hypothetical protein TELCIR_06641 [Teladorsagia circumcincta]|uniref:SCP domain-containing protein n=1 Tax=Teladorsagia circumcincta TaxID=45464 RepID=A0A2G9UMS6_TELCI|nr:hypothetical protein TELCIR_06641 [Teladorsagia circumcincta]
MEQQAQDALASCPSGGFSNPAVQVNASLNRWWGVAQQNGVTDPNNKYTSSGLYAFANMVFSETSKIGCAYKVCNSNKLIFTCLYNAM